MSSLRKCCVPTCKNVETFDCWFYNFPEDDSLCETWMKQCGIFSEDARKTRDSSLMICSGHFDELSFQNDGELLADVIPNINLPGNVVDNENMETVIDPSHLFVALFIDEAGKIVNFSLVQYETIEKWEMDERFEYGVAEIFTNSCDSMDKTKGDLLGSVFNCSKCKTMKEFGVVVLQKREVETFIEEEKVPEIEEKQETEEIQVVQVSNVEKEETNVNDIVEERLEEYESIVVEHIKKKRKPPPLTMYQQSRSPFKKSRMISIASASVLEEGKDETILGVKFYNKRSCNKCGYTPHDEELLLNHVETCSISKLQPCKNNFASKMNFKGGQRIRNNYICSKCTLSILHRDLQAHAEFHVKFAPHACKCSKCFATENDLLEHSLICGQHLFTCKMCHKEFVKKKDLFQHKEDVHGVDSQGKPLQSRSILRVK